MKGFEAGCCEVGGAFGNWGRSCNDDGGGGGGGGGDGARDDGADLCRASGGGEVGRGTSEEGVADFVGLIGGDGGGGGGGGGGGLTGIAIETGVGGREGDGGVAGPFMVELTVEGIGVSRGGDGDERILGSASDSEAILSATLSDKPEVAKAARDGADGESVAE